MSGKSRKVAQYIKPDSFKLILSFAVKSRFRFDVYCNYLERNTDK